MKYLLSLLFLFSAKPSQAAFYERDFLRLGWSYLSLLNGVQTDELTATCERRYTELLKDGVFRIHVVLGYYDWTTGQNVFDGGLNFGFSPSLDVGSLAALKTLLTDSCSGRIELCGFTQDLSNPNVFQKELTIRGSNVLAQIEMRNSSLTEYYQENTQRRLTEQKQKSKTTEEFFKHSLQEADATLYFGHSRDGGGPDMWPPVMKKNQNHVNYAYYQKHQPGFQKIREALVESQKQTPILGVFSCDSRGHFLSELKKLAPHTGFITTTTLTRVDDSFQSLVASLDALLRGQCQRGFSESLKLNPRIRDSVIVEKLFE